MLEVKILELRDRATMIPIVAIRMDTHAAAREDGQDFYLLRRAGYGDNDGAPLVLLTRADGGEAHHDPAVWGGRTWPVAHRFIAENWERIESGSVVDIEFISGESLAPKLSERFTNG